MFVLLSFLSNTVFNFGIGLAVAQLLGPDQYGRFAVAVAIAVGIQTVAFDWARVAATRFWSEQAAQTRPELRATVDTALAAIGVAVGAAYLLTAASGIALPLPVSVVGLAVGLAAVNGTFDYWTALIRARFRDRAYARLILVKNLASTLITLGGAWWFGTAAAALVGLAVAMAGGALSVWPELRPPRHLPRAADGRLARTLLGYALPVVTANLLYQTIPFADRLLIARAHGFATSGQFSLAYDIGIRVVSAVGSALDVLLFQIAVRADELHGVTQAKQQIGRNIGIIVAVLLPAAVGLWIVLPSFEAVAIPPEFRGPFAVELRRLLPGLFCYGLIFFAAHPLFQIERRTWPLVVGGLVAACANLVFIVLLPASADAAEFTEAQVAALALALAVLCGWGAAASPVWPSGRDVLAAVAATAAMAGACRLLPALDPGASALAVQVATGAGVYALLALTLDLCGCRGLLDALRRRQAT